MDKITLDDLYTEKPRWCAGCGNHAILAALKKILVDQQIPPHRVVNVSGIGCSGRAPNYIMTNSLHGIHGRPIPLAFGLALAQRDCSIFIHSGDGDALSIGGNHLIHGLHKNFNCVFILYDNQTYALTKNQTSPTTPQGRRTGTHPLGVDIAPLNAVRLALGAGGSFVAATADWFPEHMYNTLKAAYEHKGFSLVHILQRCTYYNGNGLDLKSDDWFSFLVHQDGIPADKKYAGKAEKLEHDPRDLRKAVERAMAPRKCFGLFFRDREKPCYDEILCAQAKNEKTKLRSGILEAYKI